MLLEGREQLSVVAHCLRIAILRYVAITHPIEYAQYGAYSSRALISMLIVWTVSASVAMPVFFGANQVDSSKQVRARTRNATPPATF